MPLAPAERSAIGLRRRLYDARRNISRYRPQEAAMAANIIAIAAEHDEAYARVSRQAMNYFMMRDARRKRSHDED